MQLLMSDDEFQGTPCHQSENYLKSCWPYSSSSCIMILKQERSSLHPFQVNFILACAVIVNCLSQWSTVTLADSLISFSPDYFESLRRPSLQWQTPHSGGRGLTPFLQSVWCMLSLLWHAKSWQKLPPMLDSQRWACLQNWASFVICGICHHKIDPSFCTNRHQLYDYTHIYIILFPSPIDITHPAMWGVHVARDWQHAVWSRWLKEIYLL